jgi:hypothetical protein
MQVTIATSPAKPKEPNEDFAAATANGAVLLDGAGLSGTSSKCVHGVAWYTRHLGSAILAGLPDTDRSLTTILADAITETASLHAQSCPLDDPGTPSSTVVVIRVDGTRLQYLVLADSVLVLNETGRPPAAITDDREARIGAAHRAGLDAHANGTPEHEEARRVYVETLRSYRNQPGGFWVAAANPAAAQEAITGERQICDTPDAILLSDGASRISDRFQLASWSEVLHLTQAHGPSEIIRRVRHAEAEDPYGTRWPRGKTNDDATVAHCMFRADKRA